MILISCPLALCLGSAKPYRFQFPLYDSGSCDSWRRNMYQVLHWRFGRHRSFGQWRFQLWKYGRIAALTISTLEVWLLRLSLLVSGRSSRIIAGVCRLQFVNQSFYFHEVSHHFRYIVPQVFPQCVLVRSPVLIMTRFMTRLC